MQRLIAIVLFVCCSINLGCAVSGVYRDQDRLRSALLDLYTDQIMDNLIRASNNLPIVQIDYTNAVAQLTIKDTAGLSDTLGTSNPGVTHLIAGSTASVIKSTINTAVGNLGVDRANQVSLSASPVTVGDDVYNAYREFLAIPGSVQVSCDKPPACAAHLCKKCGDYYYWVPTEYQRAFLLLSLTTTAQRGQPAAALDPFFSVNITDVLSVSGLGSETAQTILVKLDKKIPADEGRIDITIGSGGGASKPLGLRMSSFQEDTGTSTQQADTISIFYEKELGQKQGLNSFNDFVKLVREKPIPAKIYLSRHRPQAPVVNDSNGRIEFSLQQIQFNQTRLGVGP